MQHYLRARDLSRCYPVLSVAVLPSVSVTIVYLRAHFWPKSPELEGAGKEEGACRQVCGITAVSFKWCMKWKIPVWCTGRAEPLMSVKSLLQRLLQRLTRWFGLGGTSKNHLLPPPAMGTPSPRPGCSSFSNSISEMPTFNFFYTTLLLLKGRSLSQQQNSLEKSFKMVHQ